MLFISFFLSVFSIDIPPAQSLVATARTQLLAAVSHAGGYGLPVSLVAAALVSKNPTLVKPIEALVVALSAGQMAYMLRLLPWLESLKRRPLEENLAVIAKQTGIPLGLALK